MLKIQLRITGIHWKNISYFRLFGQINSALMKKKADYCEMELFVVIWSVHHVSQQCFGLLQVSVSETGEGASQSRLPDVLQTAFNTAASAQDSLHMWDPSAQHSLL